jgi:2-polyprenyl-3-methyl-5-hydroxy-6-metoxy-1,4-benzoquinol methylase
MKEFWNERYGQKEYAYGENANDFFEETFNKYDLKGKILFPAEGEGRNAVFAAKRNCDVWAFDISKQAKLKALNLASRNNVNINYQVGNIESLNYKESEFDALVLIFAHLPAQIRSNFHKLALKLLKPNALIVLEAFNKEHFKFRNENPSVGGPNDLSMLLSKEEILQDFKSANTILLENKMVELHEGKYHQGQGSVVRYIGRKGIS